MPLGKVRQTHHFIMISYFKNIILLSRNKGTEVWSGYVFISILSITTRCMLSIVIFFQNEKKAEKKTQIIFYVEGTTSNSGFSVTFFSPLGHKSWGFQLIFINGQPNIPVGCVFLRCTYFNCSLSI